MPIAVFRPEQSVRRGRKARCMRIVGAGFETAPGTDTIPRSADRLRRWKRRRGSRPSRLPHRIVKTELRIWEFVGILKTTSPRSRTSGPSTSWRLTWRYLWLLILFGESGPSAAYLHFLKQPPIYQSSSTVLVTGDRQQQANPLGTESGFAQGITQTMPHQMLIGSPLVVRKALETHELRKHPAFAGDENPASRIVQGLNVLADTKTPDVIRLSFRDSDPEVCQVALEAVLDGYRSYLGETRRPSARTWSISSRKPRTSSSRRWRRRRSSTASSGRAPLALCQEEGAKNIHQERLAGIEQARSALLIALHEKTAELDSLKNAMARGGNREAAGSSSSTPTRSPRRTAFLRKSPR